MTYFCVIIGKEEYDLLDQFLIFLWTFPSRIERYSSMAAALDHLGYSLVFQVFPYRDTGAYRQGMGGDPGLCREVRFSVKMVLLPLFPEAGYHPGDTPGQDNGTNRHIEKDMPMVVPGLQIECRENRPQERGHYSQSIPPCKSQTWIRLLNFMFRLITQHFREHYNA